MYKKLIDKYSTDNHPEKKFSRGIAKKYKPRFGVNHLIPMGSVVHRKNRLLSQQKYKPKFGIKNIIPLGGVIELGGYYKNKYEIFLGVKLPKIRIHNTQEAREKTKAYHAYSYAQGNNIYLGEEVKPLDTIEGQTTLAHEITHVLQQKYLDMSSAKEMIDPSILLEQKARTVEDRVRYSKGIDKSSGEYFRKWDVLPQRSYLSSQKVIQRINSNILFDIAKGAQKQGIPMNTGNILYDTTDVNPIKMGIGAVGGLVDNMTNYKYHDSIEKGVTQLGNVVDISKKLKSFMGIPNLKSRDILPSLLEEGKDVYKSVNPKKIEKSLEEPSVSKEVLLKMESDDSSLQQAIFEGKFPVTQKYVDEREDLTKVKELTQSGKFKSKLFDWDKNPEYQQVKNSKKSNYKVAEPYQDDEMPSREYLNFIHPPKKINSKTFDIQNKITEKYEAPIQRLSFKGAWESTKNLGSGLYHSGATLVESANSVVKLSASGYIGMVAVGADALGYDNVSKKYQKVTQNLQHSASDDLNDATRHFAQSGKHGNNVISQLVDDKDDFSQKNIDATVGARDLHYGRNKHNKQLTSESEAIALKWQKLADKKSIYHRMGKGNENNHKYVSPNGHSEAVFYGKDGVGKKGTPINSAENEATYNYYSPNGLSAVGHVATDVLPYYVWGNSKQDSTSFVERISASYDGENNPIQRKILNKYKYPVQRWSLGGAWDSMTETVSDVALDIGTGISDGVGSVVDGVGHGIQWVDNKYKDGLSYVGNSAKKLGTNIANKWNSSSFGKGINRGVKYVAHGAKELGTQVANKWNSSSIGQSVNSGVKYVADGAKELANHKYVQAAKYGAFGLLDTATAIGKGALATGTAVTGVGAVAFGSAAALDVNDAYKNFKRAFKIASLDTEGQSKKDKKRLIKETADNTDGILGDLGSLSNSIGVTSVGKRLKSMDNFVSDSAILRTLQIGTDLFIPSGITKQGIKHGRTVSKFTTLTEKTSKQIEKFDKLDTLRPLSSKIPEDVMKFAKKQKELNKGVRNVKLKGKSKKLYTERKRVSRLLENPEKTDYALVEKMMNKKNKSVVKQKTYLDKKIKQGLVSERPSFMDNLKGFGRSVLDHVTPFKFAGTREMIRKPSLLGTMGAVTDYKAFTELQDTQDRLQKRFEIPSQQVVVPQDNSEKYAKVNRETNTPIKEVSSKPINTIQESKSIEDLSIQIFRKLKSEIALEYVRSGR